MLENSVGWLSTALLLATLIAQIVRQVRAGQATEISPWLFTGQFLASAGFLAYSALVGNAVFVASNALILLTALAGEVVRRRLARRSER